MKSLNKVVATLLVFAQTNSLLAANMWSYRNGALKQAQTSPEKAQNDAFARTNAIRQKLGTNQFTINGLNGIAFGQEQGKDRRFYSSIVFKDTLGGVVRKMVENEQFGTPIVFDPSWSPDHIRIIKAYLKERNCLKSINQALPAKGSSSSMDLLLEQIMYRLVSPRKEALEDSDTLAKGRVTKTGSALVPLLQSHLDSGPVNAQGKSITQTLGSVSNVEIVEGYVHRVDFKKADSRIRASLHQMLTARSGEDDGFVELQQCLVNYLTSQKDVFTARKAELDQNIFSRSWQAAQDIAQDWLSKLKTYRGQIISRSEDAQKVTSELDEVEAMVNALNPRSLYKARLKYYMEGKRLSTSEQRAYIEKRLELTNAIVPYLQARLSTAETTNQSMKALSKAQVNYLTDMFLQLRSGDLPTADEVASMGQRFSTSAIQASNKSGSNLSFEADYRFYSVLGKQLTDLENLLTQEAEMNQAKQQDLNQIRNH